MRLQRDPLREEVFGDNLDDVRSVIFLGRDPPCGLVDRLGGVLARMKSYLTDRFGDRRRVLVQPSDPRRIIKNPTRNLTVSTGRLRVRYPKYCRRNHREPNK